MQIRELEISDAYELTPTQHADDRGVFLESYRADVLQGALGRRVEFKQANLSVSLKGTVRGVHYALVPPGQAKYVTVTHGSILDYVIDLRVGSPTFCAVATVQLDDVERRAVYLAEGLGHAFVALSESVTMSYFVSEFFAPEREFAINPHDPDLAIPFPDDIGPLLVSSKDRDAMSLSEAVDAKLLPIWSDCRAFYNGLNSKD